MINDAPVRCAFIRRGHISPHGQPGPLVVEDGRRPSSSRGATRRSGTRRDDLILRKAAPWPPPTIRLTTPVISQALISTTSEMGVKLMRSAYSTIVRDANDAAAALLDRHGRAVCQGEMSRCNWVQ